MSSVISLIARLIMGGLLVFAGVIKLQDPQQFFFSVAAFKIFPEGAAGDHLAMFSTFAFPWAEILLGGLLILGVWTRAAALVTVVMLLGFIGAVISVLARDMDVKCGCFGKIDFICGAEVGVCTVIRNTVMVALTLVPLFVGGGRIAADRFLDAPRGEAS